MCGPVGAEQVVQVMSHSAKMRSRTVWSALAVAVLALSCGRSTTRDGEGVPTPAVGGSDSVGAAGGSFGAAGAGAAAAGAGGAGTGGVACEGSSDAVRKRVVRLSFNQVLNSVTSLLDASLGARLRAELEPPQGAERAIPALMHPQEGASYTEASLVTADHIAQVAGEYVRAQLSAVTGCGQPVDATCGLRFLEAFAARAFRRPLTADELANLQKTYETLRSIAGSARPEQAIDYGVRAVLSAPQFLYRTELGEDAGQAGPLTHHEAASLLSYLITDSAPDQALLLAAERESLRDPEQVAAQVNRLVTQAATKTNLEGFMLSYFGYAQLKWLVVDDAAFTKGLREAMYHEGELFLRRTLWQAPLGDLLVSRVGYANAELAPIYGLAEFPPPGSKPDADGFVELELPGERSGLLTQPAFLTLRSRPDTASIVSRGLQVRSAFTPAEALPLPETFNARDEEELKALQDAELERNPDITPRRYSELRSMVTTCNECHEKFDAYGIVLESFDFIGRFRESYAGGTPVDPAVQLPAEVGGGFVNDATELAQYLDARGTLPIALAQALYQYALSDLSSTKVTRDSCELRAVNEAFVDSDQSFSALLRAVATAPGLMQRERGQ
jgi:Protein of unknown function (DUF1592)/Protein of unknown function (DUF1588)/Protein of unknown function (DUF1595)